MYRPQWNVNPCGRAVVPGGSADSGAAPRSGGRRRPYDLRHACLSARLNAGIDPAQVAHWAGNSVRVLLGTYATCVSGREAINRSKAEQATRADPPAPSGD